MTDTNWRAGMTPELDTRLKIGLVMVQADRNWSVHHLANPLPADRMDVLVRAVESSVGATGVRELEAQLASVRGCLARLVEAVVGEWLPDKSPGAQTVEAIRQVHRVEAYLQSLEEEQGAA